MIRFVFPELNLTRLFYVFIELEPKLEKVIPRYFLKWGENQPSLNVDKNETKLKNFAGQPETYKGAVNPQAHSVSRGFSKRPWGQEGN